MRFRRAAEKRKVLLQTVQAAKKTRRLLGMWQPPVHNVPGIERNWYESCFRSHAAVCGCGDFVDHLNHLATTLGRPPRPGPPGGPRTPQIRNLPALPAPQGEPGNRAPWPGVSGADGAGGDDGERGADGGDPADVEDDALLAAFELVEE